MSYRIIGPMALAVAFRAVSTNARFDHGRITLAEGAILGPEPVVVIEWTPGRWWACTWDDRPGHGLTPLSRNVQGSPEGAVAHAMLYQPDGWSEEPS